jgi:hypothetical protein
MQGMDHAKVLVGDDPNGSDLKDAVCAKLQLQLPPQRVRLLLEKEGSAPIALDSRKQLAGQGVVPGSSVLVDVLEESQALPPLPSLDGITGLLAQAPDPLLDAGLLAALAEEGTPDRMRLQALSQLVESHLSRHPGNAAQAPALPLFHTPAHAALLRVLVDHARALAKGVFKGNNGFTCRTLVGARGIGKTAVLRSFALVAPSAFPSLMPLLLNGQGVLKSSHALQHAPLTELLAAISAARGVAFDHSLCLPSGKRLLLMADEFDELYRVHSRAPKLESNVLDTLTALGDLGDSTCGSASALLCGSSSSTYRLVQGDGRQLHSRFPLALKGIPDLNSSKFKRLRLPSSLCNASGEVEAMMTAVQQAAMASAVSLLPSQTSTARLLTFFVGATPRAVGLCSSPGALHKLTGELLAAASPAVPSLGEFEYPGTPLLFQGLLQKLTLKNARLRKLTRLSSGNANLLAIMDPQCKWEEAVVPLKWNEVEAVFARLKLATPGAVGAHDSSMLPPASAMLMHMIDELTDKHLVHMHFPQGREAAELWPITAAQVVAGGELPVLDFERAAALLQQAAGALVTAGGLTANLLK